MLGPRALERRYPPSVRMALRKWWTKYPGKWPYQEPEAVGFWLQCLSEARYRLRGEMLIQEIEWYMRTLRGDSRTLRSVLAELRRELGWLQDDDPQSPAGSATHLR